MKRSISTPSLVALVFATMFFSVASVWLAYERMVYKLALESAVLKWVACEQGVPYPPEPNEEGIEL